MRRTTTVPGPLGVAAGVPGPVPVAVPAPLKPRRRVGMIVAGVVLIVVCALSTVWLVSSQSASRQVLALTETVPRGEAIPADALTAVAVPGTGVLRTVPADQASQVVGKVATADLLAGSLVTTDSYAETLLATDGKSVVGVSLDVAHRPASPVRAGDRVRFVQAPTAGGDIAPDAVEISAVVVSVSVIDGTTVVDAEVAGTAAAVLAQMAASGRATLVLDPPDGKKTTTRPEPPTDGEG